LGPRHTTLGAAKTSFLRGIRLGGRQRPNRKKQKKKAYGSRAGVVFPSLRESIEDKIE